MSKEDSPTRTDDVVASMNSIVELSQKWVDYIRASEGRVRLAKSFIAGALVFLVTSAAVVAYEMTLNPPFPFFFSRAEFLRGVGIGAVAGIAIGAVVYIVTRRSKDRALEELTGLIGRMGKSSVDQSGTENALSVTEKILEILPKVVRRRTNDALLLGVAAFILATLVGTLPVGVLVGVMVWLYFRYESNQSYEKQMAKLEEQRSEFEREKRRFIESL